MLNAQIKKLFKNAHIPKKAHPGDAAFDLYAHLNENLEEGHGDEAIYPGQTCKVGTGIAFTPPQGDASKYMLIVNFTLTASLESSGCILCILFWLLANLF